MVLDADGYVHVLAAEGSRRARFEGTGAAALARWQAGFRPRLRALLGLDRMAERGPCPLDPEHVGTTHCDDHVREEWTIATEPGFRLPIYLLRPRQAEGPRPLVLCPHGHGRAGKRTYAGLWETEAEHREITEGERDVAVQAVRAGYIAIAPDMRGFADLRLRRDRERNATSSCQTLGLRALLLGRTLIGERAWDMGRLIDYAATRPEIDATRIAITGNSGGGTVSLFAAACDTRITAAAPSSYFCTFEASIGSIEHCLCNSVPGLLAEAEMADVAALIAPRPFVAVAGRDDPIFPLEGVRTAYAELLGTYRVAGAEDRCALHIGPGGHRYYSAGVWPFLARWL